METGEVVLLRSFTDRMQPDSDLFIVTAVGAWGGAFLELEVEGPTPHTKTFLQ